MMKLLLSNRTHCLVEACQQALQQPQADHAKALMPISFCVPGFASEQWLIGQMSVKLKVFANVQFLFPNHIIDQLAEAFDIPDSKAFALIPLQWRIHKCLSEQPPKRLHSYLKSDQHQSRVWQLSQVIASIFDQYQLQRPDWLEQWQQGNTLDLGEHEAWQCDLWRKLSQCEGLPYYKKAQCLAERLQHPQAGDAERVQQALGGALHAFVLNPINPFVLDVFSALSQHCPVSLYALNPSNEFWTDAPREWYKPLDEGDAQAQHWQAHHDALSLLGNQQATFIDQLMELEAEQIDCYENPAPGTALGALQQHLLADEPQKATTKDASLTLLNAENPLAELQQARYQVERFLAEHPQYGLNDCSIALADMAAYEPLIPAVFYDVHYYVGGEARSDDVAQNLLDLLGLWLKPEAAFIDWQTWLSQPIVLQKMGVNAHEIHALCHQLNQSGTIHPSQIPKGIAQMCLGLMTGQQTHIDGLYADPVSLDHYESLKALNDYWQQLDQKQSELTTTRSAEAWHEWLQRLVAELLCEGEQATQANRLVDRWIDSLRVAAWSNSSLSLATVYLSLAELNPQSVSGQYLSGQLRFAPLLMVNALPTPLQIVVGVGDQSLNLKSDAWRFDLQLHHRRATDRSRPDDVANQLLNSLLSAQERLVFIYSGKELTPLLLPIQDLAYFATPLKPLEQDVSSHPEPSEPKGLPTESSTTQRLSIEALIKFWQSPIRGYCQHHRIGSLWLPPKLVERSIWQDQFKSSCHRSAVQALDTTSSVPEAQALFMAQFHFPDALLVEDYLQAAAQWQETIEGAEPLFLKVRTATETTEYTLHGQAPHCKGNTLYLPHFQTQSKASPNAQTQAWIWHLFGCASGRISQTHLISVATQKRQQWQPIDPETAQQMLQRLLEGYQQGLIEPIPYHLDEVFGIAKSQQNHLDPYTQHWFNQHPPLTESQLEAAREWILTPLQQHLG